MSERILEKLQILADAAKYDVSCSSSGSKRDNKTKGLGDTTGMGICHSYTEDGRCISLLKILLTNHCIFDCAYCVSRRSNMIKRAAFTVEEVVKLTVNFYRRNYIEGLFLSSGIFKDPDTTMERLVRVARTLREQHNFNGYIHLKTIPGASEELIRLAGLYADRLSINLELPTELSLQKLAPEKRYSHIVQPMKYLKEAIAENRQEKGLIKHSPSFVPAGQSTQMIIGATPENDLRILQVTDRLYKGYGLKRVYFSGYVPVLEDNRLPSLQTQVPVIRENRLYQADWLMRFYGFEADEIATPEFPDLDLQVDPKLAWALRNLNSFPVDLNNAEERMILRVPGIGVKSAKRIVAARRFGHIRLEHLLKMGIAFNRARFFITCDGLEAQPLDMEETHLRNRILGTTTSKYKPVQQLNLFG